MYIACQNTDVNLDTFFEHDDHRPPSLADNNEIRKTNKANLLGALGNFYSAHENSPHSSGIIIYGAAVVQSLDPRRSGIKNEAQS